MKLDAMSITVLFSFIISAYKKSMGNISYQLIKYLPEEGIRYSSGMTVDEFTSYEKFQIWRFCVHF